MSPDVAVQIICVTQVRESSTGRHMNIFAFISLILMHLKVKCYALEQDCAFERHILT